jgi:hypothetical protein
LERKIAAVELPPGKAALQIVRLSCVLQSGMNEDVCTKFSGILDWCMSYGSAMLSNMKDYRKKIVRRSALFLP